MAEVGMEGIWELADAISKKGDDTSSRSIAEVTRIDNEGTVWVHLPGGTDETPINGLSTSEVKPGDTVQVEIENGRANIVGNASTPSVGQLQVNETVAPVKQVAERAASQVGQATEAAENAEEAAKAAKAVADATSQHFWSADDGAHVTEVTQDEWNDTESENYHKGANSLWNSLGMLFRNGLNNLLALVTGDSPGVAIYDGEGNESENIVAQFTADGQTIGRSDESHMLADYHSLQLVDKEGDVYLHISDLRDETGEAEMFEVTVADGRRTYSVALPIERIVSVTGNQGVSYTFVVGGTEITFARALSGGGIVTISYVTTAQTAKAYTLGTREYGGTIGGMSYAEGVSVIASGAYSHAEGTKTRARKSATHAQNIGTIAASDYQTALGKYNVSDISDEYALIIGNGTDDSNRSNALTVGWDGKVDCGDIECGAIDSGSITTDDTIFHDTNLPSTTPSSTVHALVRRIRDESGATVGHEQATWSGSDIKSLFWGAARIVNGTAVWNGIRMGVDASGNRTVGLNEAAPWLSALGLGVTSYDRTNFTYNSGYAAYATSGNEAPSATKAGRVVTLSGAYKTNSAQSSAGTMVIGKVPSGCEPAKEVKVVQQGSGQNKFLMRVMTNGTLSIERYGVASNVAASANAWLNIGCTYISAS